MHARMRAGPTRKRARAACETREREVGERGERGERGDKATERERERERERARGSEGERAKRRGGERERGSERDSARGRDGRSDRGREAHPKEKTCQTVHPNDHTSLFSLHGAAHAAVVARISGDAHRT